MITSEQCGYILFIEANFCFLAPADTAHGKKMEKKITFKQYRNVDLAIFSVLTAVFEGITTLATTKWFAGQPVAISITLTLILIVMHRWGALSAITAVVGGAVFCIASGASAEHFLIYCVGNLFALVSLVYFKAFGKEAVRTGFAKTLLFASTAYVAVALGRFLLSLPFGAGFGDLVAFLLTDIISLIFAVVILWSIRGIDGLVEDQKHYLLRINEEEKNKEQILDEE